MERIERILKVIFYILLAIGLVILGSVIMGKIFEKQSIDFVSKESRIRLENFLIEYQKGNKDAIEKYHLSNYHKIPKEGYKKYQYKFISAKNIGESELNIKTIFEVTLFYDQEKISYKVSQYFTTLMAGKVRINKYDIQNGLWGMDWYLSK